MFNVTVKCLSAPGNWCSVSVHKLLCDDAINNYGITEPWNEAKAL